MLHPRHALCPAIALAVAAAACGTSEPPRPPACPMARTSIAYSQCGGALDFTPINQYHGALADAQVREDAVVLIDGSCTGTLIAATAGPVVITAGHCVGLGNRPVLAFNVEANADGDPLVTEGTVIEQKARNKDIEAVCAAKGMRMTEQRRVIARVLAAADDHPDVEELYRRCSTVDDRISISTVYRTVKLFEDAGIIERHDFRDGRARYEQMPESHHDHLINLRTGEVIEFQSEEIERLQAEVARRLGYRLVDHRLELYAVPLDDKTRS